MLVADTSSRSTWLEQLDWGGRGKTGNVVQSRYRFLKVSPSLLFELSLGTCQKASLSSLGKLMSTSIFKDNRTDFFCRRMHDRRIFLSSWQQAVLTTTAKFFPEKEQSYAVRLRIDVYKQDCFLSGGVRKWNGSVPGSKKMSMIS